MSELIILAISPWVFIPLANLRARNLAPTWTDPYSLINNLFTPLFVDRKPRKLLIDDTRKSGILGFMPNHLFTVSETVKTLGGTRATAELLGVGDTAVGNWRVANSFPPHTFPLISRELLSRGYTADIQLWRWERKRKAAGE